MVNKDRLVICPVYNEESYLRDFYAILRKNYTADVLFINDGSSDKSGEILQAFSNKQTFLISHSQRLGYGASLSSGFSFALEAGFKRIVTVDADLQHDPEDIDMFFRALIEVEVVLGSRYIRINQCLRVPRDRLIINRYILNLIKVLFSLNITDPFCGLRGYRDSFLKRACLREKGYRFGLEILLELVKTGADFKEIPIEAIYFNPGRKFGQGLDNPQTRLLYYLEVIARKKREINHAQKVFSGQSSS